MKTQQQVAAELVAELSKEPAFAGKLFATETGVILVTDASLLKWLDPICETASRTHHTLITAHYCD